MEFASKLQQQLLLYIYIYIYIYTLEFACALRAQRRKVEPEWGGNDRSWIRSHSTITNTITITITNTITSSHHGTMEQLTLEYLSSIGTIDEWQLSYSASVGAVEACKL